VLQTLEMEEAQPFAYNKLAERWDHSEQTAAQIDRDIQSILNTSHEEVKALLEREHDKLDSLVDTLLKDETIDQDDLERILGPRVGVRQEAIKE
jgi:cell division protease FtsH